MAFGNFKVGGSDSEVCVFSMSPGDSVLFRAQCADISWYRPKQTNYRPLAAKAELRPTPRSLGSVSEHILRCDALPCAKSGTVTLVICRLSKMS